MVHKMTDRNGTPVPVAEAHKITVHSAYWKVNEIITKAAKAKATYRARMLEVNGKDFASRFAPEYLGQMREEARATLAAVNAAIYEEIKPKLEELNAATSEAHGYMDLTRPELVNAIQLVKTLGASLAWEDAQGIVAQFNGDQSSLRLLRSAFQGSGSLFGAEQLDKMIYNDTDAALSLSHAAEQAFTQPHGSLNNLASIVGKYAKLDGQAADVIDTRPDPEAIAEAMWRGAGMPVDE